MEKSATTQKKDSTRAPKSSTPSNAPPKEKNESATINETNENEQPDKTNFEGDEREWQDPDIKPKYPTDVQARSGSDKSQVNTRPSIDETADYAIDQDDEEDGLLGSENPELLNRH